ncbi:fumarylacetoacetate hydrolase family protein [Novosphingobium sp. RL4]|uniref:fumarylacetoacetate hydrolase family protein n=1 Tax=Novosphingobium sp. RL4 TaxID=3109595 RepID=UPI002D77CDC8|nr:fumarylacetoacetate hydrolase family protein [Novosphingobium sp. RL4]WRT94406.1 fumarylacetoacetate hydrolase family protein [Novosphingobium sp. RL4]
MKLIRFQSDQGARIGIVEHDNVLDLTTTNIPYRTMTEVIAAGSKGLDILRQAASAASVRPLSEVQLLAPIERPGKYLAIGMNYAKHLEEADKLGVARSKHQVWFNKQTSCLSGPYDGIEPGITEKLDYEVELAVVIGRPAKAVSETDALDYIFGYTVTNDVSARDWQFHSPTFTMGKSFDTHGPIGPWLVTADEVPNPQALNLRSYVNGELRQSNNTGNMIHSIAAQISYLSQAFTLEPGDLIATGTPEGVGVGREPPVFLGSGDVVRCEVDGIGAIENRVI